ncbi:hypothetical protein [Ligilactobacillus apodemi]|uniref:hypothetical protein n=1 Tax=Ligilactobacillus apodemi TaxID=307126 RepID=UPI00214AECFA|nr:hypothetical protein [Ligilactobacillus apodemi]MCR1902326.1 hypothetical protein [Ligilactobacillus apodemi]
MTVKYDDDTPISGRLRNGKEIVNAIRHKTNGKDVRESIAQLGELLVGMISMLDVPSGQNDNYKEDLKKYATQEEMNQLDAKIKRIIMGSDHETIKLVVREILKEEGVI